MEPDSRPADRLQSYAAAVLIAIALGVGVATVTTSDLGNLGDDYPAFYGAGRIAAEGDWDELYEFDRQVEAQSEIFAGEPVAWYFPYPPQVALAYRPFAALPYRASYLLHTATMTMALALAIVLISPMVPLLRRRTMPALAAAAAFWPMFQAVTGGSNTTLTLLILAAAWRLVHEDHDGIAGAVLAALLYKPQYGIPLIGLFFLARGRRLLMGSLSGSAFFYAVGALVLGVRWPLEWWDRVSSFNMTDAAVNGFSAISWFGFLGNAFGTGRVGISTLALVLSATTAVALALLWYKSALALDAKIAMAVPGILLLSPHTVTHESAALLLTVAIVVNRRGTQPRWFLAVLWGLGLASLWIRTIGFSPAFVAVLLVGGWAWEAVRNDLATQSRGFDSRPLEKPTSV